MQCAKNISGYTKRKIIAMQLSEAVFTGSFAVYMAGAGFAGYHGRSFASGSFLYPGLDQYLSDNNCGKHHSLLNGYFLWKPR